MNCEGLVFNTLCTEVHYVLPLEHVSRITLSILSCSTNPWALRNLKPTFDKNQGTAFLLYSFFKPCSESPASREGGMRQLFPTEAEWTQMGRLYLSIWISKQIFTRRDRHAHKVPGLIWFSHYEIKMPSVKWFVTFLKICAFLLTAPVYRGAGFVAPIKEIVVENKKF